MGIKLKATITLLVVAIVGLVVFMETLGETIDDVRDSANSTTDHYRCEVSNSCFWNDSRTTACTANNVTAGDTTACTTYDFDTPLDSLFGGATDGVVVLVFLAAALIAVIVLAFKFKVRQ